MDDYSALSTPIGQKVDIYTELFVINGLLTITSSRTTDSLNRLTTDFISLHEVTITPLGQTASPKVIDGTVMIKRALINFLVELPSDKKPVRPAMPGASGSLVGREAYVQKNTFACYAVTGPFAIYGKCYLHQGTSLENLLQGMDPFFPITKASIHVLNRPDLIWQRDLVIMNKAQLLAMYILP